MTLHTFDDANRFLANGLHILAQGGITIETGTDFEEFRTLLAKARPDHILGDPLEPRLHNLNQNNAVWVVGRNAVGKIVHTQALRMVDLKGHSLSGFLRYNFRDFPPSGVEIDMQRSRFRGAPSISRLTGTACYHAEYWIGDAPRDISGNSLSTLLCRYAFWEALTRFDPDYMFCFMQKSIVLKGHSARSAYMHIQPGALRWFIKGMDKPVEGYLSHMSREDMRFTLDMPLEDVRVQPQAA